MFILILDSRTAIGAAREAAELCLQAVIPSLFPMSILTAILSSLLIGRSTKLTAWLCKICGMSPGTESIYLTGLLGGYPLGAKIAAQAYAKRSISKQQAEQLLAFCSNAGPAYIFGICGCLFTSPKYAWWLWGTQILSSMMVATLFSKNIGTEVKITDRQTSLSEAMHTGLKAMATVSGWIMLFRVLSAFLDKWVLFSAPPLIRSILNSFLELTNGIISMQNIPDEGTRFVVAAGALSFGGYCVVLQTRSLTADLSIKHYVIGKSIQTIFSVLIAGFIRLFCFQGNISATKALPALLIFTAILVFLQKTVEFFRTIIYNTRNLS